MPRADDIPPIAVTLDDSAPCRTNPLGAKGCGESGAIGGPPCIANGVMDALSELGIKQLNTPLTPVKVWQAIRDAKAANGWSHSAVIPGRVQREHRNHTHDRGMDSGASLRDARNDAG